MFLIGHELDNLPQPKRLFLGGRKNKTAETTNEERTAETRDAHAMTAGYRSDMSPSSPMKASVVEVDGWMLVGRWLNLTFIFWGGCVFLKKSLLSEILLMEEIRLTTWDVESLVYSGINYWPQLVCWISEPSTVPSISIFFVPWHEFQAFVTCVKSFRKLRREPLSIWARKLSYYSYIHIISFQNLFKVACLLLCVQVLDPHCKPSFAEPSLSCLGKFLWASHFDRREIQLMVEILHRIRYCKTANDLTTVAGFRKGRQ